MRSLAPQARAQGGAAVAATPLSCGRRLEAEPLRLLRQPRARRLHVLLLSVRHGQLLREARRGRPPAFFVPFGRVTRAHRTAAHTASAAGAASSTRAAASPTRRASGSRSASTAARPASAPPARPASSSPSSPASRPGPEMPLGRLGTFACVLFPTPQQTYKPRPEAEQFKQAPGDRHGCTALEGQPGLMGL